MNNITFLHNKTKAETDCMIEQESYSKYLLLAPYLIGFIMVVYKLFRSVKN